MTLLQKPITYFGKACVVACDGRCDKAFGINGRKTKKLSKDPDDHVYLGDDEVGVAPSKHTSWEGDDGKPSFVPLTPADSGLLNRWCTRECERSVVIEPARAATLADLPDMQNPKPNITRGEKE